MKSSRILASTFVAVALATTMGCVTVGRRFPVENVPSIRIGTHSQADIERMFGPPWRTGMEDGRKTWTYGDYKWSLAGATRTRDLVVRFDPSGTVTSYSFSSDQPEDADLESPASTDF